MTEPFQRAEFHRLKVHVLPTKQFKTNSISLFASFPLTEETVTGVSLIAHVMRRVNGRYRVPQTFREQLEEMFGAGFAVDMQKRANQQIVCISMDLIRDEFSGVSLLADGLQFIFECLCLPPVGDGRYLEHVLAEERRTIELKLAAVQNDKIQYAAKRCIEEMCRHEPYRLSVNGIGRELDVWDGERLYAFYQRWLREITVDLYICGDTSLTQVTDILHSTDARQLMEPGPFDKYLAKDISVLSGSDHIANTSPKEISEAFEVNQAKLNIGMRTSVTGKHPLFPALRMFNGIFGGFAHSKLFMNVREKHSLAYYVSSRVLDSTLGLLLVQSGIDSAKKTLALEIIQQQLADMRNGHITDEELALTVQLTLNSIRSTQDSAYERINVDYAELQHGRERTIEQMMRDIETVTIEQIAEVASSIQTDLIYFLHERKEVSS